MSTFKLKGLKELYFLFKLYFIEEEYRSLYQYEIILSDRSPNSYVRNFLKEMANRGVLKRKTHVNLYIVDKDTLSELIKELNETKMIYSFITDNLLTLTKLYDDKEIENMKFNLKNNNNNNI